MIVFDNKGFETRSDCPNSNWYEDKEAYVVDETTEEGRALAAKIVSLYPFYNFVLDDNGKLIDVEGYTPTDDEKQQFTPPPSDIDKLNQTISDLKSQNAQIILQLAQLKAGGGA